jgi:hypothetical protein
MCEHVDWIRVAQKSDLKGAVAKTAVNYPISKKKGNEFLDTLMAAKSDCDPWT